ncbi:MAG: biopolymer transporter ExbD [Deltaproteobacteria bacterium]|nr:biopolymer transporter ExbD [Deltaproteobacteria bacterium]
MKFKHKESKKLNIEITPLIDVIFLLLIFFMVSTTFISNPGIDVKLPEASQKPKDRKPQSLEIILTKDDQLYLDGKLISFKGLEETIRAKNDQRKISALVIKADGRARHQKVVSIMDAAKQAGIKKLSIGTVARKP